MKRNFDSVPLAFLAGITGKIKGKIMIKNKSSR